MKIALFHNSTGGGVKRAVFEHARHLRERGHVLDAYVPSTACEDYLPIAPLCGRVYTYPLPPVESGALPRRLVHHPATRPFWRMLGQGAHRMAAESLDARQQGRRLDSLEAVYASMADEMNGRGYDLIYCHQCRFSLTPSLLRHVRIPSVYYCHDTLRGMYEWSPVEHPAYDSLEETWYTRKWLGATTTLPWLRLLQRRERQYVVDTRASTLVLANSWYSREAILRTTGVNAHVCYLGVDSEFYTPDPGAARERMVLSVGALIPSKRHEFVLESIARIPPARRPRMQIIGYEYEYGKKGFGAFAQGLFALAERRGVELDISKEVSDETLRDGYRRASVMAFAPYLEPFGFVTLEAMACGTPVVGVSEGGLRETIQDGVTGLLTGRDPGEFGAALDRLLTDKALATELGANGRKAARCRWNWGRSVEALERYFAQALEGPAGGTGLMGHNQRGEDARCRQCP